ncbi:hypothetical protein NIES4071_43370 [Calothrix sp. NIES-4071]|nr:hypothetical protein NIES4071_43370 [Calothrix sp. NIES-4071]BAZ58651.1 hypothetical protein NIES4105_43300 [Calothrix sp. NIES-4105]
MVTKLKLSIAAAGACLALGISGAGAAQANAFPNTRNLVESVSQKPTCTAAPKLHALEVDYIRICDVYVKRKGKWVFKEHCNMYSGNRCTYISNPGTVNVTNCRSIPYGRSELPQHRVGNISRLSLR